MKSVFFLIKSILILLMVFQLTFCVSASKNGKINSGERSGSVASQWEAKAMIKSLETGEANVVSLDVLGLKPNIIRMEVTSSLGIALASILIKEKEVEYILPKQKKYYHGIKSDSALFPALNIRVNPEMLSAVFFEESYPKWKCQADNGMIVACTTPEGVEVRWEREGNITRRISLSGPKFEVQVQMKNYELKSNWTDKTWALQVPEDFKKYKLK